MCQRSPSWFCPLERHLGVRPTSLPQSGGPEEAGLCHSRDMEEKKQPLLLQNHFALVFLWPRVSVTGPSLSSALTSSQGAFLDTTLLRCGDSGEQHCDFCPHRLDRTLQGDGRKLHTQAPIEMRLTAVPFLLNPSTGPRPSSSHISKQNKMDQADLLPSGISSGFCPLPLIPPNSEVSLQIRTF
ncbi:uncharacterized protein LOC121021607 isoform X2 [Herpailurus yagouaroundi]|uniref:uncharacterized protein LOC121021607 isoform X2 n=1 Tax=Herpailurus yagouaroundi TaxID=1608482 RepID=UPI001AD64961|nr:uncharacterized protein LOC121021607 isoform X2 [Puma yagouaroundi]